MVRTIAKRDLSELPGELTGEVELQEVGGHLMLITRQLGETRRHITSASDLIEVSGRLKMDPETLEQTMKLLKKPAAWNTRRNQERVG